MKDIQTFALGQIDHGYIAVDLLIPENCGIFYKIIDELNSDYFHIVIDNDVAKVYKFTDEDFQDCEYIETIEFA